jgi:hypothetical protein
MPLEIKEIVITANVSESSDAEATSGDSVGSAEGRAELIADCVEQVLEILSEKMEP